MRLAFTARSSLNSVFWPRKTHKVAYTAFMLLLGILLLVISAKISIPFEPVPMTMQNLAVLFIGMAFGWRLSAVIVLLYLIVGMVGGSVLVGHAGHVNYVNKALLNGPLAGYLLGMLPAAIVSGYLVEHGWGRSNFGVAAAAMLGMAIMYAFGLSFLSRMIGWPMAISLGLYPFLFVDMLKVLFLTFLIPLIWKPKQEA